MKFGVYLFSKTFFSFELPFLEVECTVGISNRKDGIKITAVFTLNMGSAGPKGGKRAKKKIFCKAHF